MSKDSQEVEEVTDDELKAKLEAHWKRMQDRCARILMRFRINKPDRFQVEEVTDDELKAKLEAHKKWLESGRKEGDRADFRKYDLRGKNFNKQNLKGAYFREACLQGADFTGATGLLPRQLAGASLARATLPKDIAEFKELAHIEETSRNARKIFLTMLLGCVYSWLTIATTSDAHLLTNSASSPLPIIGTEVPIAYFYWTAPAILFSFYFYLHLYLQRLWEGLAGLPAIFPDGKPLDKKAYPWLLAGLVRSHFVRLEERRPALSRLQNYVSVVLAWWVVPLTLFAFWARYLVRHEWFGSGLHILLLVGSAGFGLLSYCLARAILRGAETHPVRWLRPRQTVVTRRTVVMISTGALAFGALFALISFGAIEGAPGERVPLAFKFIGYRAFADLREADVSTRLERYDGDNIAFVKGAKLKNADLRFANAKSAFLVKADLRSADVYRADFASADLRDAKMSPVKNLRHAILDKVNLSGVNLRDANLSNANLRGANLKKAILEFANLRAADLSSANLQEAELDFAILSFTKLYGADMTGARNLTQEQLDTACGDDQTRLPAGLAIGDGPCSVGVPSQVRVISPKYGSLPINE